MGNVSPAESISEGVSKALVNEVGSGNKRKHLSDTSLDDQSDSAALSSLEEFPTHEKGKLQTSSKELVLLTDSTHGEEELLEADWNDPLAFQIEELLIQNLLTIFTGALKKIVESGYTTEVAEWAMLNSGLFHGNKDCVSNVADGAVALLKREKEFNNTSLKKYPFFKETKILAVYMMLEMIHVLREVKPALSISEAMWCLLISDLNLLNACVPAVVDKPEVPKDNSKYKKDGKLEYSISVEEVSEIPPDYVRIKSDSGRKARGWPNVVKENVLRNPKVFKLEKGRISEASFKAQLSALESISIASKGVDEVMISLGSKSSKRKSKSGVPASCPVSTSSKSRASSIPKDKIVTVHEEDTDETVLVLNSHKKVLEKELQGWTDWANAKVMEVAKRLAKDTGELKFLRLGKQVSEEKRESDKELALSNANGQIEVANFSLSRLEEEKLSLKEELKGYASKAAGCLHKLREAEAKEEEVLKKVQLAETESDFLMGKLRDYKQKTNEFEKQVEKAKERMGQFKVLLEHEEKEKKKFAAQQEIVRLKKERKHNLVAREAQNLSQAAETNLKKHKKNIYDLKKLISELKLESTRSKIAAFSTGCVRSLTSTMKRLDNFRDEDIKRERECIMCMADEIAVVFLPCAHQILCGDCSVRHEKEGMNDCPSCRAMIEKRVLVNYRV